MSQQANEHAIYVISVAAERAGMHPQTLRIYERRGLLQPARTQGGNRRYSELDIARLRRISELTAEGMNVEGIRRVMYLEAEVLRLRNEVAHGCDLTSNIDQSLYDRFKKMIIDLMWEVRAKMIIGLKDSTYLAPGQRNQSDSH